MKRFLSFLCLLTALTAQAGTLPKFSSGGNEYWYYLQFTNGKNVLAAQGNGAQVSTESPTGASNQLWKAEGSSTSFTLTCQNGQKLYVNRAVKEGMFYSSTSASSYTTFVAQDCKISGYTESFELSPTSNKNVAMNQWGGAGTGKQLGLWTTGDTNNPFRFVTEEEMLGHADFPLIPYPLKLTKTEGSAPMSVADNIIYNTDNSIAAEGYRLKITPTSLTITSSTETGKFYALQTLWQLQQSSTDGTLPLVDIDDKPAFGYRGFMLDISRHFFTPDEVKKLLVAMAHYKINKFHWHLCDDQGWRVEIPEYPLLTQVGAVRKASNTIALGEVFKDDTEYGRGMYYTLDQLRDIVKFADSLHIEIIPEYDIPGHNVAAVASYPELLSCDPTKKYEVRVDGGISKDVLNVGKPEVMDFLKCVIGHIAEVFPSKYIHLGGDECPTDAWQTCADIQKLIRDKGLSGVNEVQAWLLQELGDWLKNTYNKEVVCWDELLAHWPSRNTLKPVIMAWNTNANYCVKAYEKGMKSICVPYNPCYLDFMQAPQNQNEFDEAYIGGWTLDNVNTLSSIYALDPLTGMPAGASSYIFGPQANLWTETCSSEKEMHTCYFPRILALSEVGWLPNSEKGWTGFSIRLQPHRQMLDALGMTYSNHGFNPVATTTLDEAKRLLKDSKPGQVGYPSQEAYDALKSKLNASEDELKAAVEAYKSENVKMPEPGKLYTIKNASTYYKQRYCGSSLYVNKDNKYAIHYTPQLEPEEVWYVDKGTTAISLTFTSLYNDTKLKINNSSNITVTLCKKANDKYSYVPGVMTIKNLAKYLTATASGLTTEGTAPTLQYPGTWYIEEITDFNLWLDKLGEKSTRVGAEELAKAIAERRSEKRNVTQEEYAVFVRWYEAFMNGDTGMNEILKEVRKQGNFYQINPLVYVKDGVKYLKK